MNCNRLLKIIALFIAICFVESSAFSQSANDLNCINVHTDAYFQKGDKDWKVYIDKNVNAAMPTLRCAPAKTYYIKIRFLVERDGTFLDVKPLSSAGYGMEDEVIRVIKQASNWTPATQNGKRCRTYKCTSYIFVVKKNNDNNL